MYAYSTSFTEKQQVSRRERRVYHLYHSIPNASQGGTHESIMLLYVFTSIATTALT